MAAYLFLRRLARSQFRVGRRHKPTGCTVVHTAESAMDVLGPDVGAENVASWMTRRDTPGSYHDLADSDSVIQLVRYEDEAYQDGTGSNPWGMSISFACRTTDWARMSSQRRAAFLANGAKAFARQQAWLRANGHPTTPLRRITKAQSEAGEAGFIPHGDRDPNRRTDPGKLFPWDEFFDACAREIGQAPTSTFVEDDDMDQTTFNDRLITALRTDAVRHELARAPWTQPYGRTGTSFGNALSSIDIATRALLARDLHVDLDEELLAAQIADALPLEDIQKLLHALEARLATTPKES